MHLFRRIMVGFSVQFSLFAIWGMVDKDHAQYTLVYIAIAGTAAALALPYKNITP